MTGRDIQIRGARTHNLKEVSCTFPQDQLTVVTGPSGSGKSSLAFDTLYAEGQRRFIESMSSYARQFLERIEKPDVDEIQHILPAIALEQKNSIKNARSTVGTATEIYDYLQILFASIGKTHCPQCGAEVTQADPLQIEKHLQTLPDGTKLLLLAPVSLETHSPDTLIQKGFFRIFYQEEIQDLAPLKETFTKRDVLLMVVDRVILRPSKGTDSRLLESIKQALLLGDGKITLQNLSENSSLNFENRFACQQCHQEYTKPYPQLFSFNSPLGACPICEGFGRVIGLDMDKVIPNKAVSLQDGAIHPFTMPSNQELQDELIALCKKSKIPVDQPYERLTDTQKAIVIDGKGGYPGVRGFFDWLETKKYKVHVRVMLAKYRGYYDCPDCLGSRLRAEAHWVTIHGKTIQQLCNLNIQQLRDFFLNLELTPLEQEVTQRVMREATSRIQYLYDVGLTYLTLARQSRTLSGGESQRINLSSALGCGLTDTLYVLDEPTVGLHSRDTERLLGILKTLRDHGNTVVLVEHDPDMILAADHIIDMGPGGGEEGGRILYEGNLAGLLKTSYSPTAHYLNQRTHTLPKSIKLVKPDWIEIIGAKGNNLKNLTVALPTHQLVCVTGVSGSGKSTLIKQTLYTGYQRDKGEALTLDMAEYTALKGLERFKDVILVDQTPPGRSARSNPVTYVKAYDEIRALFADSRKAMILGLTASHFSFNTAGGRCETCEGLGTVTIDMQFMADVTVVCSDCKGQRFNPSVLSVDLFGKNISDVLEMTVDEAVKFFKTAVKVRKKLEPLQEIGLGYLKLGQSTSTLSGGEAQRLKLASYLKNGSRDDSEYLFLFDEPTTGLHLKDIDVLVSALRRLLEQGYSVIVIEHNLDFIVHADYLLDLGPGGGDQGGTIMAQGPLANLMADETSETARFLRAKFEHPAETTQTKSSKKAKAGSHAHV